MSAAEVDGFGRRRYLRDGGSRDPTSPLHPEVDIRPRYESPPRGMHHTQLSPRSPRSNRDEGMLGEQLPCRYFRSGGAHRPGSPLHPAGSPPRSPRGTPMGSMASSRAKSASPPRQRQARAAMPGRGKGHGSGVGKWFGSEDDDDDLGGGTSQPKGRGGGGGGGGKGFGRGGSGGGDSKRDRGGGSGGGGGGGGRRENGAGDDDVDHRNLEGTEGEGGSGRGGDPKEKAGKGAGEQGGDDRGVQVQMNVGKTGEGRVGKNVEIEGGDAVHSGVQHPAVRVSQVLENTRVLRDVDVEMIKKALVGVLVAGGDIKNVQGGLRSRRRSVLHDVVDELTAGGGEGEGDEKNRGKEAQDGGWDKKLESLKGERMPRVCLGLS